MSLAETRLGGVIFDWAGTVMDYGCMAPAMVFIEGFRAEGVEITLEEARLPMGKYKRDHIAELLAMPAVAARWQAKHGRLPDETDIDRLFADFIPRQNAILLDYAVLIPGIAELVPELRSRGLKIGSTTGYTEDMMRRVAPRAAEQGFTPDCIMTPDQAGGGRPAPWMCFRNAMQLDIFPMWRLVKVGDTLTDIEEGLNAGMWTVGVTRTGNELGMTEAEAGALPSDELAQKLAAIEQRMRQAGAHYIIESAAHLLTVLEAVEERLKQGKRP